MENLLKTEFMDIRLSAMYLEEAFALRTSGGARWSPANLKAMHQHSTYEIFFVCDGTLSIVTEKKSIDCESSLVIIPPLVNHYTVSNGLVGNCMYFDFEKNQKKNEVVFTSLLEKISKEITVIPLTDDEKFYTGRISSVISGEMPKENMLHLITLLFLEIFTRFSPESVEEGAGQDKKTKYINTIDTYISGHYSENISLSNLAEELYLCEKQVSRIIKKEYGCSLSELLNRRRIAVATMLLKYTTMPIGEIALSVGYEYENYFFAVFKRIIGRTPKKYRDENA